MKFAKTALVVIGMLAGLTLHAAGKAELRGCIKTEAVSTDKMPRFRVLFAGKETMSNSEGFFSLPLEEQVNRYALLICKSVKQNFVKTNTIRNMCMVPEEGYRYYEFEKVNNGQGTWRQQEKRLHEHNPVAPDNCVIVLLDPACVAKIEPWRITLADNTVKLPAIVLKREVDTPHLSFASASSLLLSLDEKPFHETVKEEVKKVAENNAKPVLVSLTQ
ncbi:hypothetical protein EBZ39_13310 [bacterium]|nr:hypothetical protein [bacterium]